MLDYIIIYRHEDEVHIERCTKGELERQLNDGEFEGYTFVNDGAECTLSLESWPSRTIAIIKGSIVTPKPTEKVVVYDLP